ncbi:hypothetical protein EV121DRAFT_274572, partial [Schizophyllum commune]
MSRRHQVYTKADGKQADLATAKTELDMEIAKRMHAEVTDLYAGTPKAYGRSEKIPENAPYPVAINEDHTAATSNKQPTSYEQDLVEENKALRDLLSQYEAFATQADIESLLGKPRSELQDARMDDDMPHSSTPGVKKHTLGELVAELESRYQEEVSTERANAKAGFQTQEKILDEYSAQIRNLQQQLTEQRNTNAALQEAKENLEDAAEAARSLVDDNKIEVTAKAKEGSQRRVDELRKKLLTRNTDVATLEKDKEVHEPGAAELRVKELEEELSKLKVGDADCGAGAQAHDVQADVETRGAKVTTLEKDKEVRWSGTAAKKVKELEEELAKLK